MSDAAGYQPFTAQQIKDQAAAWGYSTSASAFTGPRRTEVIGLMLRERELQAMIRFGEAEAAHNDRMAEICQADTEATKRWDEAAGRQADAIGRAFPAK